jgi:hypothetical protein
MSWRASEIEPAAGNNASANLRRLPGDRDVAREEIWLPASADNAIKVSCGLSEENRHDALIALSFHNTLFNKHLSFYAAGSRRRRRDVIPWFGCFFACQIRRAE